MNNFVEEANVMLTPKENLLEALKFDKGRPECLPNDWTMCRGIAGDPIFKLVRGNRVRGTESFDQWGTKILFPEDAPAAVPYVTPENQVIKDITEWQKYVKAPDLRAKCSEGWEAAIENVKKIDHDKHVSMVIMGTGIFEQLHMLMTFEDTLMNMLLEPEAMQDLIDYNEVFEDFKAVQDGNVYVFKASFVQSAADVVTAISEIRQVLEDPTIEETTTLYKLK